MSARTVAHVLFRHWRKMLLVWVGALALGGGWIAVHPPRWRAEASLAVEGNRAGAVDTVAALVLSRDQWRSAVARFGARLLPAVPPAERLDAFGRLLAVRTGAGVVQARLDGPDGAVAAQALAAVLDAVRAANDRFFAAADDPGRAALEHAAERARLQLDAYRSRLGSGDPRAERARLAARRATLDGMQAAAQADAAALGDKVALLQGQVARVPATIELTSESERPRVLDEARSKLFQLETREQELLGKYLPTSPLVRAVEEEKRQVERSLRQYAAPEQERVQSGANPVRQALEQDLAQAEAALASAKARLRTVSRQQAELDGRLSALAGGEAEFDALERAAAAAQARLEAVRRPDPAAAGIGIVQQAQAAFRPVGPGPAAVLGLAASGGAVLALLAAVLAQRFGGRLDTPDAVERRLGLTVLTSIPREG